MNDTITISRPNDRVAACCKNCADRGLVLIYSTECLRYGGAGGSARVCDSHIKRVNVIDCPMCGYHSYFVELANKENQLTGKGFYECKSKSCTWTSGDTLIPAKGVML